MNLKMSESDPVEERAPLGGRVKPAGETTDPPLHSTELRSEVISQAAVDFFYFQNRLYPRRAALDWVGNRYCLTEAERHLLHRGVFSQRDALRRLSLRCLGNGWMGRRLFVDGHNVQISVESAIRGRTLLKANDGAVRDLAGESSKYRFTETSEMAMDVIFRFLGEFRPVEAVFLFDAPMSHSGDLAASYRGRMKKMGIRGDAAAVPVPEREFPVSECVIASSDGAVIDRSPRWFDFASAAMAAADLRQITMDFSHLLTTRVPEKWRW